MGVARPPVGNRGPRRREFLARPGLTVTEVAERLGYAHASAFTHAFTRWTGVSPAASRARP